MVGAPAGGDDQHWRLPGTPASRRTAIYGTAARVAARYAGSKLPAALRPSPSWAHEAGARDVYRTAVRLRGGFLKFGPFVSARPDLLPEPYIRHLSKLQDRVPPAPLAAVRRVVERELGPLADTFADFDPAASAASLAQVHRATLSDGRPVAVKVQYPGVAEIVPGETRDTRRLLGLVDRWVKGFDLTTIARELERVILSELDYANEAENIERFRANFAAEPDIAVPAVHRQLSGPRVLVMDWIDGYNLGQALREEDREVREEALRLLVDAFLKQILVDGFVHADPHPGNFLLQPGPRLGVVDFGACVALGDATRRALCELYAAGVENDIQRSVAAIDALGFRTRSGDVSSLVAWASLFDSGATEDDREVAWNRLMTAARADPLVSLPEELIMVGRVVMVQTGMVAAHKPSWSMEELIRARLEQAC
ncbi:MAG TPA: AarF/UbiB family protein, partial [Acidimicrobiales bacterium]|nr:AarF/UbiB family protein [Acidimicrobiales bacterium]